MKQFLNNSVLLFIAICLFMGCSSSSNSDQNNDATYEEMIIGKWIVEYQWEGVPKENYSEYIGLPQTDPEGTTDYTDLNESTTLTFRTDGTVVFNEWGEVYTKEYYIEGNNVFFSGWDPEDLWLSQKIYSFTTNNFIARKTCQNNDCDDNWEEVRFYRKLAED